MLQLLVDDKNIDIDKASFNFVKSSRFCQYKAGNYIFSLNIPYTSNNANVFGFPYRLQRLETLYSEKEGQILFSGNILAKGTWIAKSSDGKNISLQFIFASSEFSKVADTIYLPELFDEENEYSDIVQHIEETVLKTWPETNHQFPTIYNPLFYGDTKADDAIVPDFKGYLNDYDDVVIENKDKNTNTIVPQLYLAFIIKNIFSKLGYHLITDIFEDEMLRRALIYNNYALDKLVYNNFYGELYNNYLNAGDKVVKWDTNISDPGNHYDSTTGQYTAQFPGTYNVNLYFQYHPPETPDTIWFFHIEVYYGTELKSNKLVKIESGDDSIHETYHNAVINIEDGFQGNVIYTKAYYVDSRGDEHDVIIDKSTCTIHSTSAVINVFDTKINYKNHVPNIKVKDFLNEFFNLFQIVPFFNEQINEVYLLFIKDILSGDNQNDFGNGLIKDSLVVYPNNFQGVKFSFNYEGPDNFLNNNFIDYSGVPEYDTFNTAPLAEEGTIVFIKNLNAWHQVQYDEDQGIFFWKAISDDFTDLVIDGEAKTINTKLAPMFMRNPRILGEYDRALPAISAKGTSKEYNLNNDFPLRIFFYVGIVNASPVSPPHNYPFATSVKYDKYFNQVLPITLKWEEMQTRYLEQFILWIKRRMKIKFTAIKSPSFIKQFDFKCRYLFNNSAIFITEIITKVKNDFFGPSDYSGWTR